MSQQYTAYSTDPLEILRRERDGLLKNSDWSQLPDAPLSAQEKTDWATYRQALRDLPSNTVDPENPDWPTKPGE